MDDIDDSNDYNICENPYDTDTEGSAFVYDEASDMWFFNSYYELDQKVDDDASDTQELANLIIKSGSAGIFYSFDPSFYSIMKTLSSTIALLLPYDDDSYHSNDYAKINIAINTKLDYMPCWDDAVYTLRSVLMWVSFNCQQKLQLNDMYLSFLDCRPSSMQDLIIY